MKRTTLFLLVLLLAGVPAHAAGDTPDLERLVGEFLSASDLAAAAKAHEALLASGADPVAVSALLAKGRAYSADVPTGWQERQNPCADGVERKLLLFVPEGYDPAKRYRLLVDMHGGVSMPRPLSFAQLAQMKFFWGAHAAVHGYLLAIPTGHRGAEWWTWAGSQNVLSLIARVRREYNVDENLVFATGFSDGGSGSFYLALTHSTPFAGFIPLNGFVLVAGAGGHQVHLRTLVNKPIYAVNTENDSLYPSKRLKVFFDALAELKAPTIWRDIPGYRHDPTYLQGEDGERPRIWEWLQGVRRNPHPERVVWEGAEWSPGRVHWLEVTRVGDAGSDEVFPEVNPKLLPSRPSIGFGMDRSYPGPGVKVTTVAENSPAAEMGVKPGDVVIYVDDEEITDGRALRAILNRRKFGTPFSLIFRRGEQTLTKDGEFPAAEPRPSCSRTRPWGTIEAKAANNRFDVRCARIEGFDLYLSPAMVDFDLPVVVTVNGREVHSAVVAKDLGVLLARAAWDEDRTMLYLAKLTVRVPAGE